MADGSKIFSRAALDKLRSPDRLDMLLPITTPIGWMSLLAIGLLMISVILWSIFGSFTVRADGMGMILDSGGVATVTHVAGGKVSHIYVRPGDEVKRGELIARLEQAEQSADTNMAQYGPQLAANMRDTASRVYQYKAKLHQQVAAQDVISDYDGIVEEIMVRKGSVIGSGSPLCTVRLPQKRSDLTGVMYVPVDKGKRIEPGQTIQLVPNGVDVQESGSLIGVVRSVSNYPVTLKSVEQQVSNPELAQWLVASGQGAVREVRFALVKDESNPSGYLWTSFVGEHKPITPGSSCTGSIVIERRPPIEKVFYKISQWLRNR
ncbi:MAG: biotin/lipoyl-binding protein [Selenomonas sp.]|uniref:HlyD family efflux transporter periplasmic adaptor subunit n=1 Tax=Selenomonas sp. TaxID=2053611 RepID=UPI0026004B7C|nr:biotin/lipoyl-binding protein [Selenomonas sp.]MCR5758000.1 biotin/lipoyl-binding protein [Selenomonas sp.]